MQSRYWEDMRNGPGDGLTWDVYLAGSLRNPSVVRLTRALMDCGLSVFSDWFAAGPEADDYWKKYYQGLNLDYIDALKQPASKHVFDFDRKNMLKSRNMVLMLPAGKSGHLELGWFLGTTGRPGYIMLDGDPDRWDVMYQFATAVFDKETALIRTLVGDKSCQHG